MRPAVKPLPKGAGQIDPHAAVDRLRELHEAAGDREVERFPASEELWSALLYTDRRAGALGAQACGEAAVLRALLWRYVMEQAEAFQLRAVEHGREAGVEWSGFCEALGVESPQGAYQRARRLKAAQVRSRPGERRSPEFARDHEERLAEEERERRIRQSAELRRFEEVRQTCQLLLEHRDGLVLDDAANEWVSELAHVLADRRTPAEQAALIVYLRQTVDEIHQLARRTNRPSSSTPEAHRALKQATDLVHQPALPGPRRPAASQPGNHSPAAGSQVGNPPPARRRRTRRRGVSR